MHQNSTDLIWTLRLNTYVLIVTCAVVCGALALATVVIIGVVNKGSTHFNRVADGLEGVDTKLGTLLDFVDNHVTEERKYRSQAELFNRQYTKLLENKGQEKE